MRGVVQSNVASFDLGPAWFSYAFDAPLVIISHLLILLIPFTSRKK